MDIRIEGAPEVALQRLQQHYGMKTGISVVRMLILRDAEERGLWPEANGNGSLQPVYDNEEANG
jgi:hypothetical protein